MKTPTSSVSRSGIRVKKYIEGKSKGLTKKAAALEAGYSLGVAKSTSLIEQTKVYKETEIRYRDILLSKISMEKLADEHLKIINQDEELAVKHSAIKLALDKLEPAGTTPPDDDDKVTVILRGKIKL